MTTGPQDATRCRSLGDFTAWKAAGASRDAAARAYEAGLTRSGMETFAFTGLCAFCEQEVDFLVDYKNAAVEPDGSRWPNWRERLTCPRCRLNNRQRAAVGFLLSSSTVEGRIYLTEAATPSARAVRSKRPNAVGSEFLRDGTARGCMNASGLRHEDATCLSFDDRVFDVIGCFDVLEHVPQYRMALAEFHRCLRPGGALVMTVPFNLQSDETLVRAVVGASGRVEHLLPPEIHGDPLDPGGALCFYHFGWDIVSELADIGFKDAGLHFFWSRRLGHLGADQFVIMARRAASPPEPRRPDRLMNLMSRLWPRHVSRPAPSGRVLGARSLHATDKPQTRGGGGNVTRTRRRGSLG